MQLRSLAMILLRTAPLLALATCGGSKDGTTRRLSCDHHTTIRVVAEGVQHQRGEMHMALFESSAGFPGKPEQSLQRSVASMTGNTATVQFDPVPCGTYAVSVFHDEDGNGEMERDWLGRPQEGWGVSNNATGSFGPPSFEDSAFEAAGDSVTVRLKLRY